MYIYFYIVFLYRLLQDTEYSSLCYIVGPCWLPIFFNYLFICDCAGSLLWHGLFSSFRDWGVFFVVAVQTVTWLVLTCSLVSPDLDFVLTASQAFAKQQSCHKESSLSSQKAKL